MEFNKASGIKDSNKEEGEISDDEEQNYRYRYYSKRSGRGRNEDSYGLHENNKGIYSPFLGSKHRTKPLVGNAKFVRNDNSDTFNRTATRQLPNPRNILPSLMDVKPKPSRQLTENFLNTKNTPSPNVSSYSDQQHYANFQSPSSKCILLFNCRSGC